MSEASGRDSRRTGPTAGHPVPYDAVVLAGGGARRLGGADKPGVRIGGRALLDRVLAACAGARSTVVVAEPRPTAREVVWAREYPPGSGPLAALAAGVRALPRPRPRPRPGPAPAPAPAPAPVPGSRPAAGTGARGEEAIAGARGEEATAEVESVVVLSADLPFLVDRAVRMLVDTLAASGADGVVLTDADGRDQPLVAVYRRAALCRVLDVVEAESGALAGLPLRRLTQGLNLARITDPVASFDCDTWDDIATARSRIREHGHVLDEWISAAKDELGIDLDVDTGVLLDLARDAAHGVARPAAPLTTFLVGYAAAKADGSPAAVAEAAAKAAALAQRWAAEATEAASPDSEPGGSEPGGSEPGGSAAGTE
ncbi:DUF6457 domain-containing protein [Streptomyces beihaiensis]|uniref:DUF6457 domain-containing protein n=1 Tax=Streptomyces beihaiensis TaxID=2984495 RepID=A0ABT3U5I8_9ACTN|nr:DUF6457 domain-containing protein [Streptomyces beihaiensis]MCX3063852.1 DUF6457 domain-containing protein [Streptomyces beihaiensis]